MTEQKKNTSFSSCFDVIGPIMVGPSSSHTAGAINIGAAAQKVFRDRPTQVIVRYYESFAETHKGHGTDFATIAGVLGFRYDDNRVPNSIEIAKEQGIQIRFIEMEGDSPFGHPNTADITLLNDEKTSRLVGISVGGGKIEVRLIEMEGFEIRPTGYLPALLLVADNPNLSRTLEHRFAEEGIVVNAIIHQDGAKRYLTYYEIQHHFPLRLYYEIESMQGVERLVLL
ncbi:MAG: L-serine ammonia-lyase, iron-sulfur-dependent subunit beta [Aerococcaceae bacterium]|nr:L-serine ammonia-lyase, iron-sulfur-dependent subunit beta [Aerococcaceae bacterium]